MTRPTWLFTRPNHKSDQPNPFIVCIKLSSNPLSNSTPLGVTATVSSGGGHLYNAIPTFKNPQYICSSFSGIPDLAPL